jgi:hypothetical protein
MDRRFLVKKDGIITRKSFRKVLVGSKCLSIIPSIKGLHRFLGGYLKEDMALFSGYIAITNVWGV